MNTSKHNDKTAGGAPEATQQDYDALKYALLDLGTEAYEIVRKGLVGSIGYDGFRDLQNQVFKEIGRCEAGTNIQKNETAAQGLDLRELDAIKAIEDHYIDTRGGCSRETARGYALNAIRARLMVREHNHEAFRLEAECDKLRKLVAANTRKVYELAVVREELLAAAKTARAQLKATVASEGIERANDTLRTAIAKAEKNQ
jgi:hypothetical protein